jgi:hypothetical protein
MDNGSSGTFVPSAVEGRYVIRTGATASMAGDED